MTGLFPFPPVPSRPVPSGAPGNLNVLAYAGGFTVWHYRADTPPDGGAIDAATVRAGDLIVISETTPSGATARLAVVRSIENGSVQLHSLAP